MLRRAGGGVDWKAVCKPEKSCAQAVKWHSAGQAAIKKAARAFALAA